MQNRAPIVVIAALLVAGCAATTPPPRFTAVSPADPDGPEATTPPPAPVLALEPEARAAASPGDAAKPAIDHHGHSPRGEEPATTDHDSHSAAAPADPTAAGPAYSCPMHPEVERAAPGSCPVCGMRLVEREATRQQP